MKHQYHVYYVGGRTSKGTSYCQLIHDVNKRVKIAQENKKIYMIQQCKLKPTDRQVVTRKVANLATNQS